MKPTPKVTVTELPKQSRLHERVSSTDFLDCYCVAANVPVRKAAEIVADFPGWARLLLKVRHIVTMPFGLSNEGPQSDDKIGIFPVETQNDHEVIAGFNDRHLDFRISVMSVNDTVFAATWVHPHNIGGKLYLMAIMPFHILVVRNALKRVAKSISR